MGTSGGSSGEEVLGHSLINSNGERVLVERHINVLHTLASLVWMQQWRERPQRTRCEGRDPTHVPACSQPEPVGVGLRSQESSWGMDGQVLPCECVINS